MITLKIEVNANYTYETIPDYSDVVEGAKELVVNGHEIGVTYIPDVIYDHKSNIDLHLQILQPKIMLEPDRIFPCIVFVKGSAWKKQNLYSEIPQLARLAQLGYVVAEVEYRHSGIAHHPAQIIDTKNAIRYMKKNAKQYHVDPQKVIIMGDSSGGHTSCMTGMTANTELLDEPNDAHYSCEVKGIISLYGAVDVTLPYGFPTTENHQLPDSPEGMLMGYNIREHKEEALKACARYYVNETFAPILLLHGSKDKTVFCQESVNLYQALKNAGKDVTFYIVRNADHGGASFWTNEALALYDQFISHCLKQ